VRATAGTRLLLGFASASMGDTADARAQYLGARGAFARVGDPVGEAVALGALGQLTADHGSRLAAESLYTAGLSRLRAHPAPGASWWLHLGLGQALRSRQALTEAALEVRAAIRDVERSAGSFAVPEVRTGFMTDKLEPYAELVSVERSLGREDAAFAASERMRARELLDLLAEARVLPAGAPPELKEEQELRRRITDLSSRLTGVEPELAVYRGPSLQGRDQAEVREALAAAEERYAGLLERTQQARAGATGMTDRWVVSAQDLRARLAADEVFLEYLVTDTSSTAFLVTSDTLVTLDLGVGRRTLANLVDFARGTIASGSGTELAQAALRRLYQYLFIPVDSTGLLAGKHRLFIAAHAELHYLPFATLVAPRPDTRYLVQRFAITYVPSASVWVRLADRGGSSAPRDILAVAPESRTVLPGAFLEVRDVARLYGSEATALYDREATEGEFKEEASQYRILHLATFGVLNKQNPLFSYVALKPSGEEDGRLEVHEVFGLDLRSRLVVLSACQTALGSGALGDVPPGDDWVGLVQAFLYAGSAKVLATAWPVADRPTMDLMQGFYRRLRAGMPEDMALAIGQREALARPETRDPRYWGPFMLTGSR